MIVELPEWLCDYNVVCFALVGILFPQPSVSRPVEGLKINSTRRT